MTTFSADYAPLNGSSVHLDCNLVTRDNGRVYYRVFLFVQYDINKPELTPLFGSDHDYISLPAMYNTESRVLNACLLYATMRIGDTDREYFDKYTSDEMTWQATYLCEALSAEYEG